MAARGGSSADRWGNRLSISRSTVAPPDQGSPNIYELLIQLSHLTVDSDAWFTKNVVNPKNALADNDTKHSVSVH